MLLKDYPVFHAGVKPVMHPEFGVGVNSQTAVRYMRFLRKVKVDRLELPVYVYGRSVPAVPTHPAHLVVSVLNRLNNQWEVIKEISFSPRDSITGRKLRPDFKIEQLEKHFQAVLKESPYVILLDGLETNHLRVECDREHPVWPNHGEFNGGIFNVPFGILQPLSAHGKTAGPLRPDQQYLPVLVKKRIRPSAPEGMSITHSPFAVTFHGAHLSIGFSLMRPNFVHLGWDVSGTGSAAENRLYVNRSPMGKFQELGGLSGPLLRTLTSDSHASMWTGEVSVQDNRVLYRNIHCGQGVTLNVTFTVKRNSFRMELVQSAEQSIPVLEGEAWRFLWDLTAGITSTAGEPTLREGRNGDVKLPAFFAGSGRGCLSVVSVEGDMRLQTESYHNYKCRSDGFVLAAFPEPGTPLTIPAGIKRGVVEFSLENFYPLRTGRSKKLGVGIKKSWSAIFTAFRPELGGFSNNAVSANCHVCQGVAGDMAIFTKPPRQGPDPVRLVRFTVERALMDGGGYGYHRGLYLDSDPILVSCAGRIFQFNKDAVWLSKIRPGLHAAIERISANIGAEGLVVCRALSGNSGSYRWSSNGMDVVGFGHMDAYVNAWSYRALRNAAALFAALGEKASARKCRQNAESIRSAFGRYLVNPETGWVAGWRSRDGKLHDYAFLWVNGAACAFGLLNTQTARKALRNLEKLRRERVPGTAYYGVPLNLLPIAKEDQVLARLFLPLESSFENYTDGSLCAGCTIYYLRALSIYGLKNEARQLAAELEKGYADGVFCGRFGEGFEFRTWDGLPSGYEGTFGLSFGALYAVAVEKGVLKPLEPEWWPADE